VDVELRQLSYFASVIEAGSFSGAARRLEVGVSALSQQISRLENELSVRLLQRTSQGIQPTAAGMAFFAQAQLTLRHADEAVRAATQARLAGHVSVGMAPSTASVLGLPFIEAMSERYASVRLHIVESLSGNLAHMLAARRLDLAVLFQQGQPETWSAIPVLEEQLFVIGPPSLLAPYTRDDIGVTDLAELPLIVPSPGHGLRALVDRLFASHHLALTPHLEIDGLALLMAAVRHGGGVTIQPGAAVSSLRESDLRVLRLRPPAPGRINSLVSLCDDELAPAALAARVVLTSVMSDLVSRGHWPGASLYKL
jgi:LysR family tcuABC transcriptional regulator